MCMNSNEIWRQVPGFPQYMVSNLGRVKSFKKLKNGAVREIDLQTQTTNTGYHIVSIYNKGLHKTYNIGRIVLAAFKPEEDMINKQVHYLDGDIKNNKLDNIEWYVVGENKRNHFYRMGGTQNNRGIYVIDFQDNIFKYETRKQSPYKKTLLTLLLNDNYDHKPYSKKANIKYICYIDELKYAPKKFRDMINNYEREHLLFPEELLKNYE